MFWARSGWVVGQGWRVGARGQRSATPGKSRAPNARPRRKDLLRRRRRGGPVESQRRGRPEEDEIPRRVAERAVYRQHRNLERLPRLRTVSQLDLVGRV